MLLLNLALAHAATISIQPGSDWCGPANSAAAGDEIVLEPGDHDGPCALQTSGVTVRGSNARIVYSGYSSNVVDVEADDITIEDIEFGPTNAGIDAIKIKSGDRTTVRDNHFFQIGGISVAANSTDSTGIVIEGNTFEDLQSTGIYLGCHDGAGSCSATDFRFVGNLIDGVTSGGVGYGIEVKVDSWGLLADNVITDTQGPAIHLFGSYSDGLVSVVEGNYLSASRTNNVLEIGGGPAIVRNNITVGTSTSGLYIYNFGYRNITRSVHVVGNTIGGSPPVGVTGSVWVDGLDHAFENNAVDGALPPVVTGIAMNGNVDCSGGGCWTSDYAVDPAGPLTTDGVTPTFDANPVDYCGLTRSSPPMVGALEMGSEPVLAIALKPDCGPDTPTGTGTGTATGTATGTGGTGTGGTATGGTGTGTPDTGPSATGDKGCSCATDPARHGFWMVPLWVLATVRRRRA